MTAERSIPTGLLGGIDRRTVRKVAREISIMNKITEFEDPRGYLENARRKIREGAYPVFYANHTHHANIGGFIEIARRLGEDRPRRLIVPITRTLVVHEAGKVNQDEDVIKAANALIPELAKVGMEYGIIIRQKDIGMLLGLADDEKITLSMRRNVPEQMREILEKGAEDKRAIMETLDDFDAGCMVFPEGTTTGGIKKADGTRTGMINVDINLFNEFIDQALRRGRDTVFVPVGMNGYNYVVEPRTKEFSRAKVMLWYARNTITDLLHVNIRGLGEKPAKVIIGEPFGLDDLKNDGLIKRNEKGRLRSVKDQIDVNGYFMERVSKVVTPDLRGVYPLTV
jgi:hypothetical protein